MLSSQGSRRRVNKVVTDTSYFATEYSGPQSNAGGIFHACGQIKNQLYRRKNIEEASESVDSVLCTRFLRNDALTDVQIS